MLTEDRNTDLIFREKLGEYEKVPPPFLWTNIQMGLYNRRKSRRIAILKTVGMAAAILLAFLAGWQLTDNPGKIIVPESTIAEKGITSPGSYSLENKNTITTERQQAVSNKIKSGYPVLHQKGENLVSPALQSPVSLTANSFSTGGNDSTKQQKPQELTLSDTEKEFIGKLQPNSGVVKKLTDWIASVRKDSLTATPAKSKNIIIDSSIGTDSGYPVVVALNNPVRNFSRWSLKAEFTPVFSRQAQPSGQVASISSGISQNKPRRPGLKTPIPEEWWLATKLVSTLLLSPGSSTITSGKQPGI
jgi:hypothetical protein